jgi:hypothetical protein
MPITENFPVPKGDDITLYFQIAADDGVTLIDASVKWRLYEMRLEIPLGDPVVEKDTQPGGGIEITDVVERTFTVQLLASELEDLLGRYYHEAEVTGANGKIATVTTGVVTITKTKIHAES